MPLSILSVFGSHFGRSFAFPLAIAGLIDYSFAVVPTTAPLLALPSVLFRPIPSIMWRFLGPYSSIEGLPPMLCRLLLPNKLQHTVTI